MYDLEISFHDPPTLRQFMLDEHTRLEARLAELWGELEHGRSTEAAQAEWIGFTEDLLTHMEAEERLLFPSLEEHHLATLHTLRVEHLRLRALVQSPAFFEDPHRLIGPEGRELVVLLAVHVRREDECLYSHAEEELSVRAQQALIRRLGGDRVLIAEALRHV